MYGVLAAQEEKLELVLQHPDLMADADAADLLGVDVSSSTLFTEPEDGWRSVPSGAGAGQQSRADTPGRGCRRSDSHEVGAEDAERWPTWMLRNCSLRASCWVVLLLTCRISATSSIVMTRERSSKEVGREVIIRHPFLAGGAGGKIDFGDIIPPIPRSSATGPRQDRGIARLDVGVVPPGRAGVQAMEGHGARGVGSWA